MFSVPFRGKEAALRGGRYLQIVYRSAYLRCGLRAVDYRPVSCEPRDIAAIRPQRDGKLAAEYFRQLSRDWH